MPELVACENCGRIVTKEPSEVKKWHHHFCDRACSGEWRSRGGVGGVVVHA